MKKLLYIQPILPKYRQHVLDGLSKKFFFTVIANKKSSENGFEYADTRNINFIENKTLSIFGKLNYSTKIIFYIIKNKPEIILSHIDIKNITCWLAPIIAKIIGIKYYSYGHGIYKKNSNLLPYKIIFLAILRLHEKYICYNKYVEDDITKKMGPKNTCYINNTIIFKKTCPPEVKLFKETSILFIGRIRESSNIEMLIDACAEISKENNIILHIIGDGKIEKNLWEKIQSHEFIVFHGKVFDQETIISIAKKCKFGCYPGDAGLSVVHYMSLSLPTIVHGDIKNHMGPEPSYISNMYNGITFKRNNLDSLRTSIIKAASMDSTDLLSMSKNSYAKYIDLSNSDFSEIFSKLAEDNE